MRWGIILGIVALFETPCFALTRDDVLNRAGEYVSMAWKIGPDNILDVYDHVGSTSATPNKGSDGWDDRGYDWDVENSTWVYSINRWPFVVGSSVDGEAYGWKIDDTTTTFKNKLKEKDGNKSWIAGREDEKVLPGGYLGVTGIDCSRFASRLIELEPTTWTGMLKSISSPISYRDMKKGDWLFRTDLGHVLIFADEKFENQPNINLVHSVTWAYGWSEHVSRVIKDNADVDFDETGIKLRVKSRVTNQYQLHKVYSPFPQFAWTSPAYEHPHPLMAPLNQIIELEVVSRSGVVPSSVMLVLDDYLPDAITVYAGAQGFSVTPSSESGHARVKYAVPPVYWLPPGEHAVTVYASNLLDLRDGSRLAFTVPDTNDTALLAWEDAGPLPFMTGGQRGSNTPATAHWLHTERVVFRSTSSAAPLTDFVIYEDDTMGTELYRRDFVPGTRSADISEALTGFPDKTEYYALLRDELGRATSMYFHLDKEGPVIVTTVTARLNESHTGLLYGARGRAGHLL